MCQVNCTLPQIPDKHRHTFCLLTINHKIPGIIKEEQEKKKLEGKGREMAKMS
jgi:hypothetical protein